MFDLEHFWNLIPRQQEIEKEQQSFFYDLWALLAVKKSFFTIMPNFSLESRYPEISKFLNDIQSSFRQHFWPEMTKITILLSKIDMTNKSNEVNFFDWCVKIGTSNSKISSNKELLWFFSKGPKFLLFIDIRRLHSF